MSNDVSSTPSAKSLLDELDGAIAEHRNLVGESAMHFVQKLSGQPLEGRKRSTNSNPSWEIATMHVLTLADIDSSVTGKISVGRNDFKKTGSKP